MSHSYRLIVSCPDRVGIVARVSNFIAGQNGSITEANQHSDLVAGRFFMRYEIRFDADAPGIEQFRETFQPIAETFGMDWSLNDSAQRKRIVLMVSRAGRVINIHHSFLPSFAGAKPYHQAYDRGVKLIGATCHYVTEELDAGPIIEQDVHRITHCHTTEDLVRFGRDIERAVLARGLRWHLQDRVLIHGNKTVVFA